MGPGAAEPERVRYWDAWNFVVVVDEGPRIDWIVVLGVGEGGADSVEAPSRLALEGVGKT